MRGGVRRTDSTYRPLNRRLPVIRGRRDKEVRARGRVRDREGMVGRDRGDTDNKHRDKARVRER